MRPVASATLTYAHIPQAPSAYGELMYERGRTLVADQGIRLADLLWDADEILWDWVVDGRAVLRSSPRFVLRGDLGHREFFRIKPGIFELLWGMHHASLDLGLDPHMRVWTNGYPWRAWRVAREVPGWDVLLGPPADARGAGQETFALHPRFFCRADFARAIRLLLDPKERAERLEALPLPARRVISRSLDLSPFDSTLKVPELASLAGKHGFASSRILIDDQAWNVARFAATDRAAVHVSNPARKLAYGRIPNTVWHSPARSLRTLSTGVAEAIATAIREAARARPGTIVSASSDRDLEDYPFLDFSIDVPDAMVRAQWLEPLRRLRQDARPWRRG